MMELTGLSSFVLLLQFVMRTLSSTSTTQRSNDKAPTRAFGAKPLAGIGGLT
jgi:hypothetical protein